MPDIRGQNYLTFIRMCLCVMVTVCAFTRVASAQSKDLHPFRSFASTAYDAYQKKDERKLLSLCSESSPYFSGFKELIRQEFARNEKVRLELKRILFVRVEVNDDRAKLRLVVNMDGRDAETGQPAEGFSEWDHTLYLVREDGSWKLWRFINTAEEFADKYLSANGDEERAAILTTEGQPVTFGFERSLAEHGRSLLEEKGDDVHAIVIFNLALKFSEQLKDTEGYGGALVGLGDVYFAQGDYGRAADLYQQVMKLSELLNIEWGVAAMLVKVGNIHYNQGDDRQAMEYYRKSVKLYEKLGSKLEIAYALANLGNAYFSQRDYERALENYQRSLRIYEQLFDRAGVAYLLDKIGAVYAAMRKDEQAIEFFRRSMKLYEEFGNRAMLAYSLSNTGNVRYRQGNYAEAASLAARAAELATAGHAPEALWQALTLMGRAERALNQQAEAQRAFTEAISVIEKLRGQAAGNEQDRQFFFENKTAPYIAMVELSLARNDTEEAFRYAERAKGRMLLDVLRNGRADITKTMTPAEQAQEKSLNAAIVALNSRLRQESLKRQPDQTLIAETEARLQKARLEYDAYQTRIYAAHPDLKIQRGDAAPLSGTEAAALIPEANGVVLEYVLGEEKTYLFVLSRKQEESPPGADLKVYEIAINARELAARVADFRRRLADNSLDFKEPARQLYDLLLKPAQKELEGKTSVCIVPTDQLWELPFQALLSKPDRYFLEDHALFYAPSLSVLGEMRRKGNGVARAASVNGSQPAGALMKVSSTAASSQQMLLALGNPALSDKLISRSKSADREFSIGALPEAEREVKALGEIYGSLNSKILTGAAAQEETVKAEAWKYPVLHFATHGTLDNDSPLYSRLLLSSSSENEDGFLEAREIMKLELHAELVVLSACQTASGRTGAGEGLVGMSWALFIAGASTTVASQWKVDSASTASLMVGFHRSLRVRKNAAHVGKAEALRQAALHVMSDPKYRHPFFWSGFVVVGDGM